MGKVWGVLGGVTIALVAWVLLVPWDLSELGPDGRMLEEGGDDHAWMIALVACVVAATAVGLLVALPKQRFGVWFATGGMVTWAALFAWRVGTSETSGANMFMIPLLFAVIPLTVAVPLLLRGVARRLEERR